MNKKAIGLASALAFHLAATAEVTGTAYTVIYRGQAGDTPTAPPPGMARPTRVPRYAPTPAGRPAQQPGLRLMDGRTGSEIARGEFDTQLRGYMFRLPLTANLARGNVCLLLKNSAGMSLPVRDERPGDDGFAFRNPLWEAEVARSSELSQLTAERAQLTSQIDSSARDLERLTAEGPIGPASACTAPPSEADPPRPPTALSGAEVQAQAGGLCAIKWEQRLAAQRIDGSRWFADAGLSADWSAREGARSATDLLKGLNLNLPPADFAMVMDAAVKGRTFLEHADAVRVFSRAQATCKEDIAKLARAAVSGWEAQVAQVRQAPVRARQQCETRIARAEQLRAIQVNGPAYRAQIERRIVALEAAAPTATQSMSLDGLACKDL